MTESVAAAPAEWWKSFHLPEMADVLLQRSPAELEATLGFLQRELRLSPGDHVFDQCCGSGALSIPLSRRGLRVTGCDLFEPFVAKAREEAARVASSNAAPAPLFVCADAFEFVPATVSAAVINWYSSFGYGPDDATNRQMFERAAESLRPGGCLALDVPNVPGLLRSFRPLLIHEGQSAGRAVRLERHCRLDQQRGVLNQRWEWQIEGQPQETRHSAIKLYSPDQICGMLDESGFGSVGLYGSVGGEPYEADSPRLVVVARKQP